MTVLRPARTILPAGALLGLLLAYASGCVAPVASPESRLERFEFTRPQMGVPFRIVMFAGSASQATNAAEAAFARVSQLNGILSDYDPDSEINRLCHETPVGQAAKVSPELWFMLERSTALSAASDGAFDVTVGPLVNLWRRARRRGELPPANLIEEARASVGWRKLRLDPASRTVTFLAPGMRLDFGGIAKGYAADEALRVLGERGIGHALAGAAGDIAVGDPPPGERGWRVEVGLSNATNAPAPRVLILRHAAVSTGGDTFQYLEIGGRRYSHILDPRTGIGLTDRALVTVVARDGTASDGLETAASVLGVERGRKLVAHTPGAEVLMIGEGDGRGAVVRYESPGFKRWEAR